MLTLEILFHLIKKTSQDKRYLKIWALFPLYCLCRWYNVFLKDSQSIANLVEPFNTFFHFSGLKPNLTKFEIVGIWALNGVQLAVYGRKYINLRNEVIKILGTYFWYNKMITEESNFLKVVSNGQNVLKLWWLRNLTLEERIVVFRSLAISKIIFQALIGTVPSHIIKALETIQREGEGGLKNVDIWNKLTNLQILWIKRLYDDCFHEWKIIPLYLLPKTFNSSFEFHSNLSFNKSNFQKLFPFYTQMVISWSQYLSSLETPSPVLSQILWYSN